MRWKTYIVILSIIISGIFYYNITGKVVNEKQEVFVFRVIDGDTIELENAMKARLKGVNTPEKKMLYWEEARDFLVQEIENKKVEIVSFGGDKYNRLLVYVFINEKNINAKILENGFGHVYYYDEDGYSEELRSAEEFARLSKRGIWRESDNIGCVKLIKLEHDDPESLVLENSCSKNIEVLIKDDATHIYRETLKAESSFTLETSHIWNTDGDSVFVWDDEGLLVFYRY